MKYRVIIDTICLTCGEVIKHKQRTFHNEWDAGEWMDDEHDKFLATHDINFDDFHPTEEGYLTDHAYKEQTSFILREVDE